KRALSDIGTAAVPALIDAVQSPDSRVKEAATSVLAGIRDARAMEALRSLLYRELAAIRGRRWRWLLGRAIRVLIICSVYFPAAYHWFPGHSSVFDQIVIQSLICGSFVDVSLHMRRNAVAALSRTTDKRMIGAF